MAISTPLRPEQAIRNSPQSQVYQTYMTYLTRILKEIQIILENIKKEENEGFKQKKDSFQELNNSKREIIDLQDAIKNERDLLSRLVAAENETKKKITNMVNSKKRKSVYKNYTQDQRNAQIDKLSDAEMAKIRQTLELDIKDMEVAKQMDLKLEQMEKTVVSHIATSEVAEKADQKIIDEIEIILRDKENKLREAEKLVKQEIDNLQRKHFVETTDLERIYATLSQVKVLSVNEKAKVDEDLKVLHNIKSMDVQLKLQETQLGAIVNAEKKLIERINQRTAAIRNKIPA